ncbi:MAG TPA: cytochrome P450/oxidoreductase [Burkholderiaceae bacterium]|nr:cytochrome P450/oxidoreductase [Burkholderiaceae bacterium]
MDPTSPAAGRCPVAHGAAGSAPNGCPVSPRAAAFDPFQDAYMEDPAGFVRWAREQEPVFYAPQLGYWVVTRYATIKDIFRDPITFSPSIVLERMSPTSDEALQVLKQYGYAMNRTLVNEDEPVHMARRRVLMAPFTPEHLAEHEPMVRDLVRKAVDRFVDDGRADLVDQLLWEVPFTVALHFLGVDAEDRENMRRFSIAHTVNAFGRPSPEQQVSVAHTVGQFWQFAGEVLEKMRRTPDGPGWMRYSIRQQKLYPDVITDSYLHSMMMAIIVAAHETTTFASANAIKLLLQHPTAWGDLCADPTLVSPAVEECLRYSGSVASWRRRTTRDVVLEGVPIPAESKLLMVVASANHDGAHFADPDLFDIRRENSAEHLTFGFGAHQCLGKNIGRMEMQIMIEELSRRLPHMKLSEQTFEYVHNVSFRGPQHLWVEWDPAQNPERRDRQVLERSHPVRIGAPLARDMVRSLVVRAAEPVAEGIVRLRLAAPDGRALPRWTPGAHIDIECGDTGLSRQYSLCGPLTDTSEWAIAVQLDPSSRGGSAWVHRHAVPGAVLRVRGPRNHFRLDESARRLVFVAGGIGITPIMAMAERAQALGVDYEIHYSARSRAALAFEHDLREKHGDRLHLYVSEEGRRNDLVRLLAQPDAGTRIYACGPQRMLDELERLAASWPEDALHVEHFSGGARRLDPLREKPFEVELRNTGLKLEVPADKTLLEVLRACNVDVQSDCEEGLCGSCEVGVLEGEVDHRDSVLSRAERQTHQRMMACCSRACSQRLVLDL